VRISGHTGHRDILLFKMQAKRINLQTIALLLLIAFVLIQGIFFIRIFPVYHIPDEEQYVSNLITLNRGQVPYFTAKSHSGHPILYELILYPFYKTLPQAFFFTVARFISLTFFMLALILAFFIAKHLFPDSPYLPVFIVGLIAFNPQVVLIFSSVNSDSLLMMLITAFVLMAVKMRDKRLIIYDYAYLTLVLLAGFLTKERFVIILPALLYFTGYKALNFFRQKRKSGRLLYFGVAASVLSSLLFFAFISVYLSREIGLFNQASSLHLSGLFRIFSQLWWSPFGLLQYALPVWIYLVLALIVAVALAGLIWHFLSRETSSTANNWLFVFIAATLMMGASILIYEIKTGTGQGRHAFAIIVPVYVLFAAGLDSLGKKLKIQKVFLPAVLSVLFIVNLYSLLFGTGWLVG